MKTLKYILLPVLFLATSCYIYRPYTEKENDGKTAPATNKAKAISLMDADPVESKDTKMKMDADRKLKEQQIEKNKQLEEEKLKHIEELKAKRDNSATLGKDGESTSGTDKPANANTFRNSGIDKKSTKDEEEKVTEKGIKEKLQPNQFYKITAREKAYKIQVEKWEGDSLVSHIIRKPQKEVKLHKDEINEELILERRFSKPFSDLFTVGAYAAGAAAVLLIVL